MVAEVLHRTFLESRHEVDIELVVGKPRSSCHLDTRVDTYEHVDLARRRLSRSISE